LKEGVPLSNAFKNMNVSDQDLVDRLVYLNRVAKVVKGGRRFSFASLVVVGNKDGIVGAGLGKAKEVPEAIRKGIEQAKRSLIKVPIIDGTIPYEVVGHFGAGMVILRPAAPGTGVIAGGPVRAVVESAGIRDILTKCVGTNNPHNVVRAALDGLSQLRHPKDIAARRGKSLEELRA